MLILIFIWLNFSSSFFVAVQWAYHLQLLHLKLQMFTCDEDYFFFFFESSKYLRVTGGSVV